MVIFTDLDVPSVLSCLSSKSFSPFSTWTSVRRAKENAKKKTKDVEGRTDEFSIIKTGMLLFLTAEQSCQKMLTLRGQTIFFPCEWTSEMPTIFQRKNSVIAPKIHSKLNCSDAVMAFYFLREKDTCLVVCIVIFELFRLIFVSIFMSVCPCACDVSHTSSFYCIHSSRSLIKPPLQLRYLSKARIPSNVLKHLNLGVWKM